MHVIHDIFSSPVKMFLKASSTFVESNAEVSMNDSVFFSNNGTGKTDKHQQSYI